MSCAVILLPERSSGEVDSTDAPGLNTQPKPGHVEANGASIRQIGFRHDQLSRAPEPPPATVSRAPAESQSGSNSPRRDSQNEPSPPFELGPILVNSSAERLDPATQILERARERLISYESIRAEIVETVALGEHRFRLKGTYLQGSNLQLRLDCQVQVGETTGKLTEVCDGQILWSWQQIGDEQRVTRRNVRQIERAASSAGIVTQNLLLAELGFGGLPAVVASLQKSFVFERVGEQNVDGLDLVVMDGTWLSELRTKLAGGSQIPLPSHVPDRVRIYFQKDKLFPRRILYLKQGSSPNRFRPLVSLDFVNVVWDGPLDQTAFQFTPPKNVRREDITQEYIRRFSRNPAPVTTKSGAIMQRR